MSRPSFPSWLTLSSFLQPRRECWDNQALQEYWLGGAVLEIEEAARRFRAATVNLLCMRRAASSASARHEELNTSASAA